MHKQIFQSAYLFQIAQEKSCEYILVIYMNILIYLSIDFNSWESISFGFFCHDRWLAAERPLQLPLKPFVRLSM